MGAYGPFLATAGKVLGLFFGLFIVFVLGLIVYVDIWLKFHTKGKAIALIHDNRNIFSVLLTIEDGKMFYGKGDKKEMYLLEDSKQSLLLYPSGVPRFLQVPVRSYEYIRNQSAPVSPSGKPSPLTAKMLRMISDEAMLKQTWKDVRESQGLNKQKGSNLALYLVFGCLAIGAFNLYLIMSMQSTVNAMQIILKKAFGG
jgi:hypothetical protein